MKAILALEDGTVFEGESFGATGEQYGEVVFNTSMTGYQEIITDPSYKGQILTMTYPLIGSYGCNNEDVESVRPHVQGFVVREYSSYWSNWRATRSLDDFLSSYGIIGIQGICVAFPIVAEHAGQMRPQAILLAHRKIEYDIDRRIVFFQSF